MEERSHLLASHFMTYKHLDTRKIPLLALDQSRTRLMKSQKQQQIRDGTKPGLLALTAAGAVCVLRLANGQAQDKMIS